MSYTYIRKQYGNVQQVRRGSSMWRGSTERRGNMDVLATLPFGSPDSLGKRTRAVGVTLPFPEANQKSRCSLQLLVEKKKTLYRCERKDRY